MNVMALPPRPSRRYSPSPAPRGPRRSGRRPRVARCPPSSRPARDGRRGLSHDGRPMKVGRFLWAAALAAAGAAVGHAALRTEEGASSTRTSSRPRTPSAARAWTASSAGSPSWDRCTRPRRRPARSRCSAAAEAARALAGAGATWLLLQGVKRLVDRPRPYLADPEGTRRLIAEPQGTSWPSSHPAVLTTFTRVAARELGVGALGRGAHRARRVGRRVVASRSGSTTRATSRAACCSGARSRRCGRAAVARAVGRLAGGARLARLRRLAVLDRIRIGDVRDLPTGSASRSGSRWARGCSRGSPCGEASRSRRPTRSSSGR